MLLWFTRKRRDVPFRHLFWLFGAFIVLCGLTHFMDFYTFYSPVYRLSGLVKFFTALVSWGTVLALIPTAPKALAMQSPEQLEREIEQRTAELQRTNNELTRRNEEIAELNARLRRAMAETHHRVKNNLQVVSALVDLQIMDDEAAVPKQEMRRIAQHIRSLALIHELLTHQARNDDEVQFISAREAIEKIRPVLQEMLNGRRIDVQCDEFLVSVKHGTALAVLVNELVSNAVKHGGGDISVRLDKIDSTSNPQRAKLAVCDQGPGFPSGFDPMTAANTGLELVDNLARWDLGGEPQFVNRPEGGACVEVEFEIDTTDTAVRA